MIKTISKPHATWKPKWNEKERKSTWAEAAGLGKSPRQHIHARSKFTRKANEAAALAKNGVGLTKEDDTILKKRQVRLSNGIATNANNNKIPEVRKKIKESKIVWMGKTENRAKHNTASSAYHKAKADALQQQRAADFEAKGVGFTTEFGLGDVSRGDELECGADNIMNNPAGVLHPKGEATTANWIKDHGTKSIEEVLMSGEWAAYFLTTKQKITPEQEIKCKETTEFMSNCHRNPLWRIDTVDNEEQRDLRLFSREEAITVVRTYLLVRSVSAYDATGLEGSLQRYIEEMGMPHGLCLHQEAGAGPRSEYGITNPETTWVALSLIRVTSPKFADIDPVNPNRYPPLKSCIVTSFDGKTDYKVAVRGDKQKFQGTKSVLVDEAMIAATRLKTLTRRNKRKADAISMGEDAKVSVE